MLACHGPDRLVERRGGAGGDEKQEALRESKLRPRRGLPKSAIVRSCRRQQALQDRTSSLGVPQEIGERRGPPDRAQVSSDGRSAPLTPLSPERTSPGRRVYTPAPLLPHRRHSLSCRILSMATVLKAPDFVRLRCSEDTKETLETCLEQGALLDLRQKTPLTPT